MILTSNLGYPRIGIDRELKFAQEKYWKHAITRDELQQIADRIQTSNWVFQKEMGLDFFPAMISHFTTRCWIQPSCWAPFPNAFATKET